MNYKRGIFQLLKTFGKLAVPVAVLAVYVVVVFVCSRSLPVYKHYASLGNGLYYARAKVISVNNQEVSTSGFPGLYTGSQTANVRLLNSQYKGSIFQINNALNYETNYLLKSGQEIVVSVNTTNGDKTQLNVFMYTPYRFAALSVLLIIFVAALCFVGGWRGFHSVLGIVFTLTTVIFVFIPMLFQGISTIAATIILVIVTSCVTMFLVSGISRKSFSAILGIVSGVIVSAIVMFIFGSILRVSGYTMSDATVLINIAGLSKLNVRDLLFVGIIISSLGAVMDIAISITTSINEVLKYNSKANFNELFHSGMNVGRDMMGTMVNTLILAFMGSSIATFILYYSYLFNSYQFSFQQIINSDDITIQILQAVCGSLSVILTVPIVSAIAAKLLTSHINEKAEY